LREHNFAFVDANMPDMAGTGTEATRRGPLRRQHAFDTLMSARMSTTRLQLEANCSTGPLPMLRPGPRACPGESHQP